jgi:TRAP transporter TAXI family solute receptor
LTDTDAPDPERRPGYDRRRRLRLALLATALVAVAAWSVVVFVVSAVPRHFVLASGPEGGIYHRYAKQYTAILAREGVTIDERMTAGATANLQLLLDPKSRVDVAFMQGGIATEAQTEGLVMLASLYYEPMWVFYTGDEALSRVESLRGKRIAIGAQGSGTRTFAEAVLSMSGISSADSTLTAAGGADAVKALQEGKLDAAIFVGGAQTPFIQDALRSPHLRLMSFAQADAYVRRVPYVAKLTLPEATIDLQRHIPDQEVTLIATTAMLVARDGFSPALINLLMDAARDVHGGKGTFEVAGEFPGITPVDFPVSVDAERHKRFGPNFLHRYFPFWVATFVERLIVVVVPLLVILVPVINLLPPVLRWRVRSRIFRWYGELKLLERDVAMRTGKLPIEQWLRDLDRIENAAELIKIPASFASEAYTLREHIGLVRRAVLAKGQAVDA